MISLLIAMLIYASMDVVPSIVQFLTLWEVTTWVIATPFVVAGVAILQVRKEELLR